MTTSSVTCATCGSSTGLDSIAGQCPRCLIGVALSDEEDLPPPEETGAGSTRRFGDYLLGRQLGAGGMGVVYAAQRLSDGRPVAIKLIRDAHVASPALLRRFTLEAEAAARLDHPSIVHILEVGECEGHPFISMDWIAGENLEARIAREAKPAPREVARLLTTIARAVHHAHTRGILHRDLKPANILIDASGAAHLTDFGLAKILEADQAGSESATLTTAAVPGTPSYLSPEQVAGRAASPASDIYGLGAVLYAMLTGRPPFQAATPLELFRQIASQPPARPRSIDRSIPGDLETICLKCLSKDPRQRYADAAALAADLERFLAGQTIEARPPSIGRKTRQWIGRNPIGTALIVSLCVGLLIALALLKVVNDQRREMELDRDQVFDEGMQKVSQIWRDPTTRFVTISARELAILAGRPAAVSRGARYEFTLGVSADDSPATMAQRYAHFLINLQEPMQRELDGKAVFHLRLLKRWPRPEDALGRGEVDFLVLGATDFLRAERTVPGIAAIAHGERVREYVIFTHARTGARRLSDLRGQSLALPDPNHSSHVLSQARLVEAGLNHRDFRQYTNVLEQGDAPGATPILDAVLRGQWAAGVTHRKLFDRYQHRGLVALDTFSGAPHILAARPGLDPRITVAFRNALHSPSRAGSWPDDGFVAESDATAGGVSALSSLRDAIATAGRF